MRGWGALRAVAAATATTVLLAGCVKLDIDLQVQSDDTVDGTFTVAVSKQLLQFVPGGADDLSSLFGDETDTSIPGAESMEVEPYEDERFIGQTARFTGAPLEGADSGFGGDTGDLTIEREGDQFRLEGTLDLTVEDSGLPSDVDLPDTSQLFSQAEVRVRVSFPGKVIESNGDVDGCTVTWEPAFGQEAELTAVAEASGSCNSSGLSWWAWLLIGLGALVLIGAVVAIVLTLRQERRRSRAAAEPPLPPLPPLAVPPTGEAPEGSAPEGGLPPPPASTGEGGPALAPPPSPPSPTEAAAAVELPAPDVPPAPDLPFEPPAPPAPDLPTEPTPPTEPPAG